MMMAYTMATGSGAMDLLLADFADRLAQAGLRTCGVVQVNSGNENCHRCDMDVRVLPDGPMIRISQSLGAMAKGCRLDPAALEEAVALTTAAMTPQADVLIVNKFGKHEADGRGFRPVIAEALAMGIPVIVGLNQTNLDAFLEFADGLAGQVPADADALTQWLQGVRDTAEKVA